MLQTFSFSAGRYNCVTDALLILDIADLPRSQLLSVPLLLSFPHHVSTEDEFLVSKVALLMVIDDAAGFLKALGVVDGCLDFSPGADHALGIHNAVNIRLAIGRYLIEVKVVKTRLENFPLLDHVPVQTELHNLHHQKLKLLSIVMNRHALFLIMVTDHLLIS